MAKSPSRLKPQDAVQQVRSAFNAAKNRTGGEGRLVALSAGGMVLAFVLLAIVAPLLMTAPARVASVIGFCLLALVIGATGIGVLALWRMIKAGAMDTAADAAHSRSIFSQTAVESALSDAEDAGLRGAAPRVVHEAMTGRVHGRPVAVMRDEGVTYAVIRLKDAVPASLLMAPGSAPWPLAFPNDGPLTPLPAPAGIAALAWTTDRAAGLALCTQLAHALGMSAAGGDVPYLSVRGRAVVLMWRRADVGTACVIAHEVAKAMA